MKKELLRIDNGMLYEQNHAMLHNIYLRIFYDEITGIFLDRTYEFNYLKSLLCGTSNLDSGNMFLNGRLMNREGKTEFLFNCHCVIGAQSALTKNLSIAENVFAINKDARGIFKKRNNEYQLRKLLDSLGMGFSIDKSVSRLNVVQRIEIEMLKAMVNNKNFVIIDLREIYLSISERRELRKFLEVYLKKTESAVVILANRKYMLPALVDCIIAVSRGRVLISSDKDDDIFANLFKPLSIPEEDLYIRATTYYFGQKHEVLRFENVCTQFVKNLNITVHTGEVLLIISSQFEVIAELESLFKGLISPLNGEIYYSDRKYYPCSRDKMLKKYSIAIIDEMMNFQLFDNLNVYDNLCLSSGLRNSGLWLFSSLKRTIRRFCEINNCGDILDKKTSELTFEEKVQIVYLKWYLYSPRILICIKPFKSVDEDTEVVVSEMIKKMSQKGIAVVILSNAQEELIDEEYPLF